MIASACGGSREVRQAEVRVTVARAAGGRWPPPPPHEPNSKNNPSQSFEAGVKFLVYGALHEVPTCYCRSTLLMHGTLQEVSYKFMEFDRR